MEAADKKELLKQEILADADKRAETVLKRAARDAKKIRREAETRSQAAILEAADRDREEADRDALRLMATVPLEKKRRRLTVQEQLVTDAVQAACDRVAALAGHDRVRFLAKLIADAAHAIAEPKITVACAERDREAVAAAAEVAAKALHSAGVKVAIDLAPDAAETGAGVIVRADGGKKMVDSSLDARRSRLAPKLRLELASILFNDAELGMEPSES